MRVAPHRYDAVVIGTSAGGLHALTVILEELPPTYAVPLIIVQHRARDQRWLLEEVLQGKCQLRIKQADEKESLKAGYAYLAPPDYHLLIERNQTFSLSCDEPVRFSRPSIDVLFETATLVFKEKLVGIILTGASSDGTAGIAAIKKNGGLTIAQSPEEAQFELMPASAIRTGCVKRVYTLLEIKKFLLTLSDLS